MVLVGLVGVWQLLALARCLHVANCQLQTYDPCNAGRPGHLRIAPPLPPAPRLSTPPGGTRQGVA